MSTYSSCFDLPVAFFTSNGYDLEIESGQANLDIMKMLKEIKIHRRGLYPETMKQISLYVSKRIKVYESKR